MTEVGLDEIVMLDWPKLYCDGMPLESVWMQMDDEFSKGNIKSSDEEFPFSGKSSARMTFIVGLIIKYIPLKRRKIEQERTQSFVSYEGRRRFLNVEQLADALRPRFYGDRRYPPTQEPAPQPVPPPAQARLPDVIEESEPAPKPIQAPLPDIVQYPRQVRFRQEHQEQAAAAAAPIEPEQVHLEPQEQAAVAAAPIEPEQVHLEPQEQAAAAAAPIEQPARASESEEETEEESEEDDDLQLCHLSSSEGSSDETSSTDEDRRGFKRELERNPALRTAYARSEEARRQRGHFNDRPGHFWSRRNTRGRETRNSDN
ncbi:hypothetical protein DAPPUDRAFT_320184 [Daphnia pulex]|uniref:Uncharacterized protein n=1 Tax=Daphnia pulex TaxID=6669 RepID=E9GP37_DAPPU|nr:hypothetical protein DAPPUDRAFT_320184 [Daphnia pulex]|eukprot:EFX78750.1 hypothetical protein DAPPUDRAFT_320184 [Daphnia pulex]